MARQKKTKPDVVEIGIIDMLLIESKIKDDVQFSLFCRKAIHDLAEGCISENVNPLVKSVYEKSLSKMKTVQKINSNYYKRKSLQERVENKSNQEPKLQCPSCNNFEDAAIGNYAENCTTAVENGLDLESGTSSNILHDEEKPTPTKCNNSSCNGTECGNDQVTCQSTERCTEAPRTALQDSSIGNVLDERTTHPFGNVSGCAQPKSGKSCNVRESASKEKENSPASGDRSGNSLAIVVPELAGEPVFNKYGEFGNVSLTEKQYKKLRNEVYGDKVETAINFLDNYLENHPERISGKKAYKSHYAVLKKEGWVYDRMNERKLTDKRNENAAASRMSFQEQERERVARALRGESIDGRISLPGIDATEEEIDRFIYG